MIQTRFYDLRVDNDLTQFDVSKVLGVTRDCYSNWERMRYDFPVDKVLILSNYYNVSLDYILGVSKIKNKSSNKNIDYKLLGDRLRNERKQKNLTQKKLGDKVGLDQKMISSYEIGSSLPKTLNLLYILNYLEISFDYIAGFTDNKKVL